ncbi:MAG TPA: GTP cyclohydrolase MptA [Solirubrobacteraceae bacterium]|nr:GTP cyclohydrolase MptA [Solirubrobacteraceae bacterium]
MLPDGVPDVQARKPSVHVALSRVGVTNVEKVIRVHDELYSARIDCFVDLGAAQKGAHMSRFEEVINEAIGEVVLHEAPLHAELLACRIAERIRARQDARRAEVHIAARYPEHKPAPVSGTQTQEIYTLLGCASASARGTRRVVGVQATGMTACPCAQELVAAGARNDLARAGFSGEQIEQIIACVPVATHNQRGIGTLQVGFPESAGETAEAIDATQLLAIVEAAMSSEIYELMKRSDEAEVVAKAHRRPRFVEDCVREMISGVLERLAELPDDVFLAARQENLETIHQHNVLAERHGLLGNLRTELAGGAPAPVEVTLEAWLQQAAG